MALAGMFISIAHTKTMAETSCLSGTQYIPNLMAVRTPDRTTLMQCESESKPFQPGSKKEQSNALKESWKNQFADR